MTQHYNLVIATPGTSMTNGYVSSLLATVQTLSKEGITWSFANGSTSNVFTSRELTLSGTRNNSIDEQRPFNGEITYDKILWIDSDIVWNPEDVLKAYRSDKDVLSGAYLLFNGSVAAHDLESKQPFTFEEVKDKKDLIEISGAGFGFICFKQGVFESLSRPWFQMVYVAMVHEETKEEIPFPLTGEDISFCARAIMAGFSIWLDPTIQLTHQKTLNLTWDGVKP